MNFNFLREMGVLERLSLRYNVKIATMEVVAMAMHSKNSLDFCDIQLEFIVFRLSGCINLDFQVNIQQRTTNRTSSRCCINLDFQVNIQPDVKYIPYLLSCINLDFQVNIQHAGYQRRGSKGCINLDFQVNIQQKNSKLTDGCSCINLDFQVNVKPNP